MVVTSVRVKAPIGKYVLLNIEQLAVNLCSFRHLLRDKMSPPYSKVDL